MVLKILYVVGSAILPAKYFTHAVLAVAGVVTIYIFSQGRQTRRERDLHGPFTPNGLTLLDSLAQRGAHIIALTPEPPDTGAPGTLVSLLRGTTSNENIYAEQCDLASPASIRVFCENYRKSEQRLDAVIFAHEYAPVGSIFSREGAALENARRAASCATFLFITLLLPLLLTAPVERDIRLITLVNPFYAAAASARAFSPSLRSSSSSSSSSSLFLREGRRALRTAIFTRHLQRVLDALNSGSQVPRTDVNARSIPVMSGEAQRSNIVAVSVSPGISRTDVIAPLLGADPSRGGVSRWGMVLYILLNPLVRILTKSPGSASQSTLHALFLPTPFKSLAVSPDDAQRRAPEEVLKPGALYAECAVVSVHVPATRVTTEGMETETTTSTPTSEMGTNTNTSDTPGVGAPRPDDGELGGVALGMQVWDDYERELKVWEAAKAPHSTVDDDGKATKREGSQGSSIPSNTR
ncbi:hypothetical protein F5148DRAFT_1275969 [Russula earlei]|uniref:Uncharacterized protein n=1 Tax=Russula earlei TaxID=71964 RepID=A0ACC0U8P4_9AGAM|nr:hypothetical protein F5148DRAFT_1275969 [Russula earlei]